MGLQLQLQLLQLDKVNCYLHLRIADSSMPSFLHAQPISKQSQQLIHPQFGAQFPLFPLFKLLCFSSNLLSLVSHPQIQCKITKHSPTSILQHHATNNCNRLAHPWLFFVGACTYVLLLEVPDKFLQGCHRLYWGFAWGKLINSTAYCPNAVTMGHCLLVGGVDTHPYQVLPYLLKFVDKQLRMRLSIAICLATDPQDNSSKQDNNKNCKQKREEIGQQQQHSNHNLPSYQLFGIGQLIEENLGQLRFLQVKAAQLFVWRVIDASEGRLFHTGTIIGAQLQV